MTTPQEITLHIHCQDLPGLSRLRLGVQRDKDVIEDVPGDSETVTFTVSLQIKPNPKTGLLRLSGPFVHGKADDAFLYLSWGEREGNDWQMHLRTKIPLRDLDERVLRKLLQDEKPLEVTVSLRDRRGGAATGSLKPEQMEWSL